VIYREQVVYRDLLSVYLLYFLFLLAKNEKAQDWVIFVAKINKNDII